MVKTVLINSYIANTKAVDALIRSMREARGFSSFTIAVIVGGHSLYSHETVDGILYVNAPHNSFDNTAFIAMLEYPLLSQYTSFFYIHDTAVVGPSFFEKIGDLNIRSSIRINPPPRPSMNIGAYTLARLEACRDFLISMKGVDPTQMLHLKQRCIDTEDYIFKQDEHCVALECTIDIYPPKDHYGTGTLRRIEYLSSIDMFKIKSNWNVGELVLVL
jgi:hypothetical protein